MLSANPIDAAQTENRTSDGLIAMPSSEIESFTFEYGNPTFVDVVVISDLEPESEAFQSEVRSAEEALEEALDIPVRLSVKISKE